MATQVDVCSSQGTSCCQLRVAGESEHQYQHVCSLYQTADITEAKQTWKTMKDGASIINHRLQPLSSDHLSCFPVQPNSSMHHDECKDINLQRGWFSASSLASCCSRSREERLPWMVFIQVVCGHSGGRLQLSGGGPKMIWLASAFSSVLTRCPQTTRLDDGWEWWLTGHMINVSISDKVMPRILHRHHWSSASIRCNDCPTFRPVTYTRQSANNGK